MIAALLLLASLTAAPLPPRDTAKLDPKGSLSMGVFNPLRYALTDRIELVSHPLVFFVAPNLTARLAVIEAPLQLTGEVGVSVPTLAMRLTQGYLFPSWETSDNTIAWTLVPHVGLALSGPGFSNGVWTGRVDAAFGVPLGENNATPLNSFLAPLEILFAAPLTGFCGRVGGLYDHGLNDRFRLRGEVNLYVTGSQGDLMVSGTSVGPIADVNQLIVTAHAGVDIGVFTNSRVTLGVYWANYDQGDTEVVIGRDGFAERERVRSNNILPTIDFIWSSPASSSEAPPPSP